MGLQKSLSSCEICNFSLALLTCSGWSLRVRKHYNRNCIPGVLNKIGGCLLDLVLTQGFCGIIGTHRNVEVCGILLHAGRCFDPSGFSLWLKALGICRCSISHQREPILFHKHNNNRLKSRSQEITFRVTEWENHCVSHKHPRSPTLLDIQTPNSFLYSAGWIFQQQKCKVNFAEDEHNLSSLWAINDFFYLLMY